MIQKGSKIAFMIISTVVFLASCGGSAQFDRNALTSANQTQDAQESPLAAPPKPTPTPTPQVYCGYYPLEFFSNQTYTGFSPQNSGASFIAFPQNGPTVNNSTLFALRYGNSIISKIYSKDNPSYPDGFNCAYTLSTKDVCCNHLGQSTVYNILDLSQCTSWGHWGPLTTASSISLQLWSVIHDCRTTPPLQVI